MASITIDQVNKSYQMEDGSPLHVLKDVTFDAEDGELFSLLGPSGCGKSTLLSIIAGLAVPDNGEVRFGTSDGDGQIGFVFQDPTLLDWKTVRGNIKFALEGMGIPEAEHDTRIKQALELVGLSDFGDQYPQSLSGGMRQRVGIARAFSIDPEVLLMDEPFGSLDEITARRLREDLLEMWKQERKTIIFVTHDIQEAVYLSDRIGILSKKPAEVSTVIDIDVPRPRQVDNPTLPKYEKQALDALEIEE